MSRTLILVIVSLALLAGCSPALVPSFYKVDIRQGNYIDQEMLNRVRIGMSKRQVQYVLGTPLIIDPFHQQRWDYVYSFQKAGEELESRHVSLFFSGDMLNRIDGDLEPRI